MIDKSNITRLFWLLLVCLISLSLFTGCSSNTQLSEVSQIKSAEFMASADRQANELPKLAEPTLVQPEEEAPVAPDAPVAKQPVVEETTPVLSQENSNVSPPSAASSEQPVPVAPEPQILAPAPVDLSLPQEPRVGFRAPDFALQTMDGNIIRLSELTGQAVLINYWTTWCIPCQQELPILEQLHREYQQKGISIVSINAIDQDSLDKVQNTIGQFSMTFPVLLDQGSQFASSYQMFFFPTTILIDASGVIREITLGDSTEAELRASLDRVLAGGF